MIKILFLIPDLNTGGAERVLVNILRNIDRKRFRPILVLFKKQGPLLASLPLDVRVYSLKELEGKHWYGWQWLNLLLQLRRLLKDLAPHAVFSFMWYPNAVALMACMSIRLNFKLIISERTSTSTYEGTFLNLLRTGILRLLYPKADLIIAPSKKLAADLVAISRISRDKVVTIHNPVDVQSIHEKAREELSHEWFLKNKNIITAIGRLGSEKGFEHLIKAAALLKRSSIDCKLVIVGEGNERKNLEHLISELRLQDTVQLVGFQQNPYKFLSRSTVFVLSSLYEGFPNVLLEALSLGIPSVATRCPTGPDEIVTDGVNGILVPTADSQALADGIKRIMLDAALRKKFSEAGKTRAEDFHVQNIVKQFEKTIEDVCAGSAEN